MRFRAVALVVGLPLGVYLRDVRLVFGSALGFVLAVLAALLGSVLLGIQVNRSVHDAAPVGVRCR